MRKIALVAASTLAVSLLTACDSRREPYGGCDEAWQAPTSEGAVWCYLHGLWDGGV